MATIDAVGGEQAKGEAVDARLRDYRLAEFFSGLSTALDLLREAIDEMESEDGLTEAGEHSYAAARCAIAALASAEMSYYEDDGVEAEGFADYYRAIGEPPPAGAREFAQFPIPSAASLPLPG
jgi:hypothetical protein